MPSLEGQKTFTLFHPIHVSKASYKGSRVSSLASQTHHLGFHGIVLCYCPLLLTGGNASDGVLDWVRLNHNDTTKPTPTAAAVIWYSFLYWGVNETFGRTLRCLVNSSKLCWVFRCDPFVGSQGTEPLIGIGIDIDILLFPCLASWAKEIPCFYTLIASQSMSFSLYSGYVL